MDPVEIKENNDEAPYHLIGEVINDELYLDITEKEKEPRQLRKMTLKITETFKAPPTKESNKTLEVIYTYIPLWQSEQFDGGKSIDIVVQDVIEVWLKEGEHGWEPVLSGNSINHLKYQQNRQEPMPEPIWHQIKNKINVWFRDYTYWLIVGFWYLVLGWAIFYGMKKYDS